MYNWQATVREWTLELVRFPSVTNGRGETEFAAHLRDLLAAWPYFQAHPDQLWIERTAADPHERFNLFALVRGAGSGAVVLAGHYDVVDVANYGSLAPWAFDPEALAPRLIAELEQGGGTEADLRTLDDLRGGAFLPGRGVLDMKSGLAAGVAVLERFAEAADHRQGNLLLVATPDEEQGSHGMRSAARRLPAIARAWDLRLEAAINLDATDDQGDGSAGRAIFLGTVGKLLPSVYFVGHETHAGSPFAGVNPNLLAAELTRRVECNAGLLDVAEGEAAPPPVCLKLADLKAHYDVTTPAATWCYYNVLTHRRTAVEVLEMMVGLVREALEGALAYLAEQAARYGAASGRASVFPAWKPLVLTFAELKAHAIRPDDTAAQRAFDELTRTLTDDPSIDLPLFSRRVTEMLWSRSDLTGPAAVVGFGSLYYPPALVTDATAKGARLRAAARRQAEALARETAQSIRLRPFLPGISDMSFLGSRPPAEDVALIENNTPAWGSRLHFDYHAVRALDLPTINVGPWGRDYHQRTERVDAHYAFEVVPELIWRIVADLFG
jgi:arginine utilization protein RocB